MNYPTEKNVSKMGPLIRTLAAVLLVFALIAVAGLIYALVSEPFHPAMLIFTALIGLMSHVAASVAFRGYAPKYLLFAHGPK